VISAAERNNKVLGVFLFGTERVAEFIKKGFLFISIGNDLHHLVTQASSHMATIKDILKSNRVSPISKYAPPPTGNLVAVRTKLYSVFVPRPEKRPSIVLKSIVVKGFGRGGKQLGCPTANLEEGVLQGTEAPGVWMGWAKVRGEIYKCVASIGWNPFFKNEKKTCEPHILHRFDSDFYGEPIEIVLCGYIRPETDFKSLQDLIDAINRDIEIAKICLDDAEFSNEQKLLL
jgi:riboflavin kinase